MTVPLSKPNQVIRRGFSHNYISLRPHVQGGSPTINGTRLPVESIAAFWWNTGSVEATRGAYPYEWVNDETIRLACWSEEGLPMSRFEVVVKDVAGNEVQWDGFFLRRSAERSAREFNARGARLAERVKRFIGTENAAKLADQMFYAEVVAGKDGTPNEH